MNTEEMLPPWATAKNKTNEIVQGLQLCTKDGRRIGNAHVLSVKGVIPSVLYGDIETYNVLTDAGSHVVLTKSEIHELFYLGDWISDIDEIIERFGRKEYEGE